MRAVIVALGLLAAAVLIGLGAYHMGAAVTADRIETANTKQLEAEFDKGMRAGVEYQEWFCENEVEVP